MLEEGDLVRVVGNGELRKIVGIGPGEFLSTQIENDGGTFKPFKRSDLELVAKARRPDTGLGFVAPNPFTM